MRNLREAMQNKAVPVGIRQTLLNLAEFMEHEVEVREISGKVCLLCARTHGREIHGEVVLFVDNFLVEKLTSGCELGVLSS